MAGFNWGSVDWGSLAQAGASIYASNQASKAAQGAGNVAAQGAEQSTALQREIYQDQRNLNMPFYQGGLGAYNQYLSLMGLPQQGGSQSGGAFSPQGQRVGPASNEWVNTSGSTPVANAQLYSSDPQYRAAWDQVVRENQQRFGSGFTRKSDPSAIYSRLSQIYQPQQQTAPATSTQPAMTQQQAFTAFRNTPGYQFGLDEGQKQLQSSASASGGLFSGKAGKALTQYGQNYADQQGYTPYMNRLAGLFGGAQTAGGQIGSAGQNFANQAGANMQNAADSRASGLLGSSQAKMWGIGQAGGFLNDAYGYYQNGGGR